MRRVSASTVAAVLLLGGCSGSSDGRPLHLRPPTPAPGASTACTRLEGALPQRLDGRPRVRVTPTSPYTAAWGDPPVVLRCGVARPKGLTATSEVIEVNGVAWFLVETRAAYVFTTVGRRAFVEARVPTSVARADATAPLVDLARPVARSIPLAAAEG